MKTFKANREEKAWVAGMYEGEGCIYASPAGSKNFRYPRINITSIDYDILKRIQEIVGFGFVREINRKMKPGWKVAYNYEIMKTEDIWTFIDTIYDWLGERRREQIRKVTRVCYTEPQKCTVCKNYFTPGVDRRRGSKTCSDHCSFIYHRRINLEWHRRNYVHKRVSRRTEERASRD